MSTRLRTIGCRYRSTILMTLAAAMLTTGAHAANERAMRSLAHSNYLIRQQQAYRYNLQATPQTYRGTPHFPNEGGVHRTIRQQVGVNQRFVSDWKDQKDSRWAGYLTGGW